MAAAAHSHLPEVLVLTLITLSLALAQDENGHFIYNDFREAKLHLDGPAYILHNGILQLTSASSIGQDKGFAFYRFPIKFNLSSYQSASFSTNFVFAMVPQENVLSGHAISFVISPSTDFSNALPAQYLGLFNRSTIGLSENHILAVELDTFKNVEFNDIDDNHLGINVNTLESMESAPASYFSDAEGKNKRLKLNSGDPMQIWICYSHTEKLLNVTLAPITLPQKPSRPLLSTRLDLSTILLDSMYVGFSASTGQLITNHYILGWSFSKSGQAENLNISRLPSLPRLAGQETPAKTGGLPLIMIIVLIVALVLVLTTISGAIYIIRKKQYEEIYEDWEREYGPQRFSYKTLYKATKGFKDAELIGKGGFGKVYKGVLPSNLAIAVKKVSHNSEQRMKEFVAEIVSMGKLRHRNLVRLHGYCRRKGELLLVYDYLPNGSLDKILYSNKKSNLNWYLLTFEP